jgi:gliding motility-associated-like protein
MKHKLLIIITLSLSLNLYSQIDEKNLINKDIYVKNDSLSLMTQSASDEWLAEYIKVTHAKLLQESSEKTTRASVCNNLDFEEGNFTGWTCQTGLNNGYPAGPWTGSLPVANRHTIETGGTDPYGGFPRVAPGGGNFSVRLGNNGVGAQAERIIFSFIVGPEDTNFIYKYAVVFQDPGHSHEDQPYFELKILNSLNQVIACGQQHYTAASNIPGFLNAGGNVWYKPWTTVGIRLADYVGQPVTVIVTNADCSLTGHFGYGYVDFICPHNLVAQANTFCEYDNAATLSVPNISPGATYLWSTGETTPTININPQNFNDSTIQCYVTPPDVPTGCGFWYTFPIKILHIDPNFSFNASCLNAEFFDSTLINYGNVTYWQWDFGDGNVSNVQNPIHSYSTSGTYNVTLSSGTPQCQSSITFPVNAIDFDLSITKVDATCYGYSDGQATAVINGGTPPFTFQWSNGESNQNITNLTAGNYSVTVSDNNGCVHNASITINQPPPLTIAATANTSTICYGDSVILIVSGANTYLWSNGLGSSSNVIAYPTTSTTYSVTGTNVIGCTATTQININVNPLPILTANSTPPMICYGESSILSVSGASTYSWSHSLGTGATKTVSPTSSTTYTVTGTDFNNCSNTTTVSVAVNPLPTVYISASLDTICYGDFTTLTASGANTYQWNTADNTASITVSPANSTIYTVTGTDINNCSSTASISILVNPLPTVISSATPNIICLGENSIITATGANNYSWSHSLGTGATKTVSPTSSTTYTVTGTDFNNCSNTTTVTVSVNPLPIMSIAMTNSEICFGESTYISASGAMGYQWSNSLGNSSTILVSPNITSTYTVTGTNQYGCTSSLSATVVVNPLPNVIISPDSIEICDNNSVTLTASGAINYLWANGLGTNANITIAPHNNTVYMVTGTNQYGCTNSARAQVIVHPLPVVTINPNSIELCLGDSATLIANGANSYLWNNAMGNNSTIVVSPQITTDYNVTGTNQWGCTSSTYSQVIVHSLPNLSLTSNNNTICNGHSTTLCAYGADHYLWSNGSTQPSIIVTPSTTTYYSITGFSIYNCIKIDSILVTVNPTPVVDFVAEPLIGCEPLAVKFINNSDNGTSFWYFGDNYTSNISSPLHVYTSHGTYSVTLIVKNQYNCLDTITKLNYITVYPSPIAGFTVLPNYTSEEDGLVNIIDHSIGATSWYYDFGVENDNNDIFTDKEPKYKYSQAGDYNITQIIENEYGCLDTTFNSVTVRPSIMFYLPNAFTPNEDDKNAFFMPLGFNISPIEYEFRIYDRWGKQLFFTTDFNVGWDGKYKGEFVKQDIYVYMVKVRLEDGVQVFRGSVYLLK